MQKQLLVSDVGFVVRSFRPEIDAAIHRVLDGGWFILGPEVEAFEADFRGLTGSAHGISVASGTDALELALRAVGVLPRDLVITVSHTATATAAAIERAGAVPWFVDVDPDRYTMNADALEESFSAVQGRRVGAVVPVHLYGVPADMDPILRIASSYDAPVVEDAAQAHGAVYRGKTVGSIGSAAAFSFYPTKNLGALGDAGIVTTEDTEVAEAVTLFRQYGWRSRFVSETPGTNSRMDELQAAILRVLLPHLDELNEARRTVASLYGEALSGSTVNLPFGGVGHEGTTAVFHQYVVRVPASERDAVRQKMADDGIQTSIHYPTPVHLQPAFVDAPSGNLETTERISREILSLPIGMHVTDDDVERVSNSLLAALAGRPRGG